MYLGQSWPGSTWGTPVEELGKVTGEKAIWVALLTLLPLCDPDHDRKFEAGLTDKTVALSIW